MVLKSNDRRTSCPCHDEFRGPCSDYVRQAKANSLILLQLTVSVTTAFHRLITEERKNNTIIYYVYLSLSVLMLNNRHLHPEKGVLRSELMSQKSLLTLGLSTSWTCPAER
ncbi:hypothetical protein TNCV_452011 [Trichonephila clavipes]|nr:hypothetical protein TNCV_452011 [Trichonephila clavipes]